MSWFCIILYFVLSLVGNNSRGDRVLGTRNREDMLFSFVWSGLRKQTNPPITFITLDFASIFFTSNQTEIGRECFLESAVTNSCYFFLWIRLASLAIHEVGVKILFCQIKDAELPRKFLFSFLCAVLNEYNHSPRLMGTCIGFLRRLPSWHEHKLHLSSCVVGNQCNQNVKVFL